MSLLLQLMELQRRYPRSELSSVDMVLLNQAKIECFNTHSLDALLPQHAEGFAHVFKSTQQIPLTNTFGSAPSLFAWIHKERYLPTMEICKATGHDYSLLNRAGNLRKESRGGLGSLLERYSFCEKIEKFNLDPSSLFPYLRTSSKEDFSLGLLRTCDYQTAEYAYLWGKPPYNVYLDSCYALAIMHHNEPMVFCGIHHDSSRLLSIIQLQGVCQRDSHGKKIRTAHSTSRVRWEDFFVETFQTWAKTNGYARLRIHSARNNRWFYRGSSAALLTRGLVRYDGTAQRHDFIQSGESGDWFKDV